MCLSSFYLLPFKNFTILSLSFFVSNALVCICIPIVSHCSGEKDAGGGVLWHFWQFSAHNCAPDLAATAFEDAQPLVDTTITMLHNTIKINVNVRSGLKFFMAAKF